MNFEFNHNAESLFDAMCLSEEIYNEVRDWLHRRSYGKLRVSEVVQYIIETEIPSKDESLQDKYIMTLLMLMGVHIGQQAAFHTKDDLQDMLKEILRVPKIEKSDIPFS